MEGMLRSKGFSVGGLHGDLSQAARMEALNNFKTGKTGLLVATDVAARGLDIPNVAAVINYTFPLTIEDYIHRIGRTGEHKSLYPQSIIFSSLLQAAVGRAVNQSLSSPVTRMNAVSRASWHEFFVKAASNVRV